MLVKISLIGDISKLIVKMDDEIKVVSQPHQMIMIVIPNQG